jgi:hypothetical protein
VVGDGAVGRTCLCSPPPGHCTRHRRQWVGVVGDGRGGLTCPPLRSPPPHPHDPILLIVVVVVAVARWWGRWRW